MIGQSKKLMALVTALVVSMPQAYAGHGVGNGGDHVRATFIKVGQAVVNALETTELGEGIVSRNNLNVQDLLATLDIRVIEVSEDMLIDSGGSVVDALGSLGKIVLSNDRWVSHFEKERDVYFLVFHEMLRASGVNDDNYIISRALNPFPATRKILTRLATLFPILGEVSLDQIISADKIVIAGNGCPKSLGGTFADFDLEKNILSVGLQRFDVNLTTQNSGRKSCSLVLPVNPPAGKKVVLTQMDFSAKIIAEKRASVTISSAANYGGVSIPPESKTFEAKESSQGSLLIRSHRSVESNCSGTPEILKIVTAVSIQRPARAEPKVEQVVADQIAISFAIEDCAK